MFKLPAEMDLPRIEAAIRTLAVLAWEQCASHTGPDGQWTGPQPKTQIGHIIEQPVLMACKLAHAQLDAYLARTIGPEAAAEITKRINTETGANFIPQEVSATADQVRH